MVRERDARQLLRFPGSSAAAVGVETVLWQSPLRSCQSVAWRGSFLALMGRAAAERQSPDRMQPIGNRQVAEARLEVPASRFAYPLHWGVPRSKAGLGFFYSHLPLCHYIVVRFLKRAAARD